jgi:hypothetical protein
MDNWRERVRDSRLTIDLYAWPSDNAPPSKAALLVVKK